ncbi:MAG: tripartite tricarboxylate transporter substrate binding protein [Burkholderiales bacterium]|nr:tripartite tricarboxylate transporter substrate binding protein [Burkholderiales bacterium]
MQRRQFLAATAALSTAGAWAQSSLPAGPVRIVVGFPPGGGTDVLARILAQKLGVMWNIPVIVENKAGAAGVIAADYVSKQPSDGNTLLMAHINSNGIAPGLYPKLGYSADRDFAPITMVGLTPMMLVCAPSQPVKTLAGIVDLCRKKPGSVVFGSAGAGSAQHLALEELRARAKIDVLHVPYKGSAPLMNDLLGGQVQYCFEGMTTATPFIKSGRLAAIAQTRAKRSKSHPSVPTVAEQGYPGFDTSIWFALAGPGKLPGTIARRMNADVNKVLLMPDVAEKLDQYGAEDGGGTPERLDGFMRTERAKWAKIIRDAKITADS